MGQRRASPVPPSGGAPARPTNLLVRRWGGRPPLHSGPTLRHCFLEVLQGDVQLRDHFGGNKALHLVSSLRALARLRQGDARLVFVPSVLVCHVREEHRALHARRLRGLPPHLQLKFISRDDLTLAAVDVGLPRAGREADHPHGAQGALRPDLTHTHPKPCLTPRHRVRLCPVPLVHCGPGSP